MNTTQERESQSLQLWPRGRMIRYSGSYPNYELCEYSYPAPDGPLEWRPATPEENREIQANVLALMYQERDVLCCDSSLVSKLIEEHFDGFDYDDIQGVYVDPSDWDLEQCRDYLRDEGAGEADDLLDPWSMDRAALVETLNDISIDCRDDESDDVLRQAVIENINDETLDGLDDWREAVRSHSLDNPREAYEWWRVNSWLCHALQELGEIVIDNDYGEWWGRTCTGQAMIMDGVLQQVAYNVLDR